jgi:alkylhydroperoxidase family enzyme
MFQYHTKDSAPAESQPQVDVSVKTFGFLPKLHAVLAEAPFTYELYNTAFAGFQSKTTFSTLEQQIVMMTANYENRCHYCTAGHSMIMKMQNLPDEAITALRDGKPLGDRKLEALRTFTRLLIEKHGHVGDSELQKFLDAGYTKRQALEVLSGIAAKVISNYTNALAHTEIDEPVKSYAWTHPDDRAKVG